MRQLSAHRITEAVRDLSIRANCFLNPDLENALSAAKTNEPSLIGREMLTQLLDNAAIARQNQVPICQDTGLMVIFVTLGQEVHITDGSLSEAIQEGVRQGYTEGYLRKSVVKDPFLRENTRDNTPAILHYTIVPGDTFQLDLAPKGAGSENMSRLFMLKPSDGIEGAKKAVLETAEAAGPNPCPPMVIGVGCGGNFETAPLLAKQALLRPISSHHPLPHIRAMEEELLQKINATGIGPQGLGGRTTAFAVHVEVCPTHIACLPVAVNISCHVTRHAHCEL